MYQNAATYQVIHWNGPSCHKHGVYLDYCQGCHDEFAEALQADKLETLRRTFEQLNALD
jgi:hypothetical protein